jgi:hypothetical protein
VRKIVISRFHEENVLTTSLNSQSENMMNFVISQELETHDSFMVAQELSSVAKS